MGIEIERKYRLLEPPGWLDECSSTRIEQGYLAVESDTQVRLRLRDGTPSLTVKRGSGETRLETVVELGQEDFTKLWPLTEGRRLAKTRYHVPHDGFEVEVDVFEDDLDGLVTGEVEFDSEEESGCFSPPDWLGDDVTGEKVFANESLALHGLPKEEREPP